MEKSKDKGMVFGALLVGAAVGGILGILLAPEKGSKTRKVLSEKGDDLFEDMKGKFNHLLLDVKSEVEMVKKTANDFIREASEKVKSN